MRHSVPLVSLAVLVAACQPATPKVDAAAEEAAIRAQVAAFQAAVTSYDEAAIGAVYAPDAGLLPANMPRLTGRAAIEQFFGVLEPAKVTLTLTPTSVVVGAPATSRWRKAPGPGAIPSRTAPRSRTTGSTWWRGRRSTAPG